MIHKAIEIALHAHKDHTDKSGCPYIFHPLRVMLNTNDEFLQICAVLHDVVEDTNITFDDLKNNGFSKDVIETLKCLTKHHNENYDVYIERVLKNENACKIKINDLKDNMNIKRIANPTEKDYLRLKKYENALNKILNKYPNLKKQE